MLKICFQNYEKGQQIPLVKRPKSFTEEVMNLYLHVREATLRKEVRLPWENPVLSGHIGPSLRSRSCYKKLRLVREVRGWSFGQEEGKRERLDPEKRGPRDPPHIFLWERCHEDPPNYRIFLIKRSSSCWRKLILWKGSRSFSIQEAIVPPPPPISSPL